VLNATTPDRWAATFLQEGGGDLLLGRWMSERAAAIAVDRAELYYRPGAFELNVPRVSRKLKPASAHDLRIEAWHEYKAYLPPRAKRERPRAA
jgi:hypothetical protein